MDINVDYLLKRTREEEGKDKPDDRDRTIKAQLAPRMVDLKHHKKLSDVFSVLGDMTEGTQPLIIPFHHSLLYLFLVPFLTTKPQLSYTSILTVI